MNNDATEKANKRTTIRLLLLSVGMFAFAIVILPPLYELICDLTGLNGKTGQANNEAELTRVVDKDRLVTIEFVTNVNSNLPWEFSAAVKKIQVHPGEVGKALFYARNRSKQRMVGQAIPSLAPGQVAPYFSKTECFCFTQQVLEAGQEAEMPVRFVVDPRLPKRINTITLSYTFYNAGKYEDRKNVARKAGAVGRAAGKAGPS
ncbi:MAG: cytochrome c oxidase assembly protein [Gammaproteobacteria bacterium]|nr:MAG: cytochrome c oxidase assembly protein [Gammaproteobacteria bacterium]